LSGKNNIYYAAGNNLNYVLDSYALLAFFNNEKGAETVKDLLLKASNYKTNLFLSNINFGEIVYIIEREFGINSSQLAISRINEMPLEIISADMNMTLVAAHFKANYPISFADAFAAALTEEKDAILVTGDREFERLTSSIEILWL
jgi:predicted nucleic acid-binding protein